MELGKKIEVQTILLTGSQLNIVTDACEYDWLYDYDYNTARLLVASEFIEELSVDCEDAEDAPVIEALVALLKPLGDTRIQFIPN